MKNVFSVDLESWYYANGYQKSISKELIEKYRTDLWNNTHCILDLLGKYNTKATFFVLGRLAEAEPDLIHEIAGRGHEIACHGFEHRSLREMNSGDFRKDLELSINAIYNACGVVPKGYRAPYFSIEKDTQWAFDVLKEFNFKYDSSIQPIRFHTPYGSNGAEMKAYKHETGIIEIPLSCAEILNMRIPCSGGAYFRFYPYPMFNYLLNKCNKQGRQGIFYLHPWELGNSNPKIEVKGINKFRKYYNSNKTKERIERLFQDYKFVSMKDFINNLNL
ncbi:MAG: DUF3473 domain-containing protein [FCB group bacterium]|jgi:polysaccharide deacetylase family protein (PEP-CTERM system associated)